MSSLAKIEHLDGPRRTSPFRYCDPATLEAEQRLLPGERPGYAGHELMVPNPGDYGAATRDMRRRSCATMMASSSSRTSAAPPGDRQGAAMPPIRPDPSLDLRPEGSALGAAPAPSSLNLGRSPLHRWNGLLFDGKRDVARDLARIDAPELDFAGYVLDRVHVHECEYNWKTFIEVYLEDYHVGPFHPGLGQFVTCDDLRWKFGDRYSLQTVGVNNALAKPGTKIYERWHKAVVDFYRGRRAAHGAIWMTLLPERDGRVVSERACCEHAPSSRRRSDDERRRVLLSGGDRALRARIRRGRAGGVHGNG
jgi:hypothetical protein